MADILTGLVGYWKLDDNPANDGATLSTGDGTTNKSVAGQVGQAINFDGSNDYIDAGSDSSLDMLGPLTISAWVNPSAITVDEMAVIGKYGVSTNGLQFGVGDFYGTSNNFYLRISGKHHPRTKAKDSYIIGLSRGLSRTGSFIFCSHHCHTQASID